MINLPYLDNIIVIIRWPAGFFAFNTGVFIDILLVLALLIRVIRITNEKKEV